MLKILNELKYSTYLSVHPFKGFWDIKHDKLASIKSSSIIIIYAVVLVILRKQLTAYVFNPVDILEVNVFYDAGIVIILFFTWCIANWGLTTLFDGEGSFKDIFIATAYSLVPLLLIQTILIPLSHFFSLREMAIFTFISNLSLVWTAILIILGVTVTHQYTLTKSLVMIVCIILGMSAIGYIYLLFFNLLQQILGFISNLYTEIVFRFN